MVYVNLNNIMLTFLYKKIQLINLNLDHNHNHFLLKNHKSLLPKVTMFEESNMNCI